MPIRLHGRYQIHSVAGSNFERTNLRIGEKSLDRGIKLGPRDDFRFQQLSDARWRLSL